MTATAAAPQPNTMALARQKVVAILTTEDARRQIAPFLRPGVSLARVVSTINQVVADNPEILECTPESIVMAVGKGVSQDLEFGETIHLVPFNVKVKLPGGGERFEKRAKAIRDWKGDIELVKKSGAARDVDAQCFYEHEPFVYHQGTSPYIEHHPIVDVKKRGRMVGAYAWALISQRQPLKVRVMAVDEIDTIRQAHSKRWKVGPLQDWYACKTLVHQITKFLPKNPRLREIEKDIELELQDEIPEGEFEVVSTTASAGLSPQSAATTSDPLRDTANPEAATTAPAAASTATETPALVEEEPDPAAMTLEQAKAMKLFGAQGAWGGKSGELLDSFSTRHLEMIKKWCVDKIEAFGDDPVKHATIVAVDLIVASRA